MTHYHQKFITADDDIHQFHHYLEQLLEPYDGEVVVRVKTAAHEVYANIIRHAYQSQNGQVIDMESSFESNFISIALSDNGVPFEGAQSEAFKNQQFPTNGMGLYVAQHATDLLQYTRLSEHQNLWVLEFKFPTHEEIL